MMEMDTRSDHVGGISLIPVDLLLDILMRLPVKDILRSRSVCKEWNFLSRTPKFISLHYNRSLQMRHKNNVVDSSFICLVVEVHDRISNFLLTYFTLVEEKTTTTTQLIEKINKEEDLTTMLSSLLFPSCPPSNSDFYHIQIICPFDGLICFGCGEHVIMYNPATRESQVLPSDPQLLNVELPNYNHYILGVWFESTMKLQYKVFRMTYWFKLNEKTWCYKISIYDSTVNSWRVSQTIYGNFNPSPGLLLNGVVHFCMQKNKYSHVIVTFDARLETFGHLELPSCLRHSNDLVLLPFRGNLACLQPNIEIDDDNIKCEVWVMTEYGVEQSWTQKFSVYCDEFFWPLAFWRNGDDQDELLGVTSGVELFSVNLITLKKTNLELPFIDYDLGNIVPYNVESLHSLKVCTNNF